MTNNETNGNVSGDLIDFSNVVDSLDIVNDKAKLLGIIPKHLRKELASITQRILEHYDAVVE